MVYFNANFEFLVLIDVLFYNKKTLPKPIFGRCSRFIPPENAKTFPYPVFSGCIKWENCGQIWVNFQEFPLMVYINTKKSTRE